MGKFDYLKSDSVTVGARARYTFHNISVNGKSPTLVIAPAAEPNKPYFNAMLKQSGSRVRRAARGKMDAGMIAESRAEDRVLFPQFVVKEWEDTVDEDGMEVPFTKDDCADFLNALPDDEFDDLRNYAATLDNFRKGIAIDTESLGKN